MAGIYEQISVKVTPLFYEGMYGETVDVTKDVDITALVQENIGSVNREIDNGDYDIGVFTFGAITLKCFNDEGLFSAPQDSRSIFKYKRDLARVKILYLKPDQSETLIFEGLINEDTVRDEDLPDDDFQSGSVRLRVLSLDSIFRHVKVAGGAVATGISISDAIKQILNTSAITNVLNFDPTKITVQNDVVIDDGEYFTNINVKDALDELLLAANSVLIVDSTNTIVVTPRLENAATHYFYAPQDPLGRGNIIDIKSYNSGLQRCFSAVEINETEVRDQAYIDDYGYRLKSVKLDFITNIENIETIATNILSEFKTPRAECILKAPLIDCADILVLDKVSIDYPYRVHPPSGEDYITTIDTAVIGESKINIVTGAIKIEPEIQWKVIGITPNLKSKTTQLKLRQIGKNYGEGIV